MPRPTGENDPDRTSAPLETRGAGETAPKAVLEQARRSLETKLAESEDWRALKQLEAREAAGEWFDVIESDVLRDRLTLAVSAAPEFLAWQFIDAAIGCLEAGDHVADAGAYRPSMPLTGLPEAPAGGVPHALAACQPEPRPIELDLPSALPVEPQPALSKPTVIAAQKYDYKPLQRPARELSGRIPTLQARDSKEYTGVVIARPADLAQRALERALVVAVNDTRAVVFAQTLEDEPNPTRFSAKAASIEEAEVQIVVRQPAPILIDTRLPPLPLTEPTSQHDKHLPRTSRTPALKWAEPDATGGSDYRPLAAAHDEAQVAIIATGTRSNAELRAERRELGIAPDRERNMRRFLRALGGE